MVISYAITVKDEIVEIKKLLGLLEASKESSDEIVVVWDSHNGTQEVYDYLQTIKINNFKLEKFYFNNNFSELKNYLNGHCSGEYIYNIDADELLDKEVFEYIKTILTVNNEIDLFYVPRINTVEGLTQEHIDKWGWNVSSEGWINFPDYQARIYKNKPEIKWTRGVHETITGFKSRSILPTSEMFCIKHHKQISRQEKQNSLYEQISRETNV